MGGLDTTGPLVSIIIVAHNAERFLRRALDSALGQTYRPLEVIVVDDGSTDHTPEIIAACRDSRLVSVRQENAGIGKARNEGLRHARGAYVTSFDADDW